MSKRRYSAISILLTVFLLLQALGQTASALETEVTLFDATENVFGDSPTFVHGENSELASAQIHGKSTDSIANTQKRVSHMSVATVNDTEERLPLSLGSVALEDRTAETQGAILLAGAEITLSKTNLCLRQSGTSTVLVTVGGFSGTAYISAESTNGDVCTGEWGKVEDPSVKLRLTANSVGDCAIFITLTQNGRVIAQNQVDVSVIPCVYPKVTVSPSSLEILRNDRATVMVTHNLPGANVHAKWEWYDNGVISCYDFGPWDASGTLFPIYVNALKNGNASVKLGLYNRFDELLAYTYIDPVKVYELSNPTLTLDGNRVTMYTGDTSRVRVSVKGVGGEWDLNAFTYSPCNLEWKKVSDSVYDLYVGGSAPTSGTITVQLRDANKNTLKSADISLQIISRANPRVTTSSNNVSVVVGSGTTLVFTVKDCDGEYYLGMNRSSNVIGCQWGDWFNNGSSISCNILGYAAANATLTVSLCRASDNSVLHTITISIRVTTSTAPAMAFGFENYDVHTLFGEAIPLSTCQIIFGNGSRANTVFNRDYGRGGVCFGMSAVAALIYHGQGNLELRNFDKRSNSIYGLSNNLRYNGNPFNSVVNLTLRQIVEAMHVSQYSSHYAKTKGVKNVANQIISEVSQGRAVMVGMRGDIGASKDCGHAVLAYDCYYPSAREMLVKVYNPNNLNMSTISFTRTSDSGNYTAWSFYYHGAVNDWDWGTGKPNESICSFPLSSIADIWNSRGSAKLRLFSAEETETERMNLFVTSEKSFELYVYDTEHPQSDGKLVLKCENGLVTHIEDNILHMENWGVLPDGTSRNCDMLFYLPIDYYIFKDLTLNDGAEAVLSDNDYSVSVDTAAHEFDFFAEDATKTVGAVVSAGQGDAYEISINSSVAGEPDCYRYSSTGLGETVSVSLEKGELVVEGVDDASVSVTAGAPEKYYAIHERHTTGGTVVYEEGAHTDFAQGDSCRMEFVPDEGYQVFNVNIDGTDFGRIDSYCFTDISDNHQIAVDFRYDISVCNVSVFKDGSDNDPVYLLTNGAGEALTENEDYICGHLEGDEETMVFLSKEESGYMGSLMYKPSIVHGELDENQTLRVKLSGAVKDTCVIAILYDEHYRMLTTRATQVDSDEVKLDFGDISFPASYRISVSWLNLQMVPLCARLDVS